MSNVFEVKVGQLWQNWDKRCRNDRDPRCFLVESIDGERATCLRCTKDGRATSRRRSRILLHRFRPNSTGYKLVQP